MNFLVKCYSLLSQLVLLTVFKKPEQCQGILMKNIVPMISC